MTRTFTGRHMFAIVAGFFAVVIGVNMVMATEASRTFGGTVVENSYVASQHFNRWLDEAKAQDGLGWSAKITGDHGRVVVETAAGAHLVGDAVHPLGRLPDRKLAFHSVGAGRYVSTGTLPSGRWRVRVEVAQGTQKAVFQQDVVL